MARIKLVAQGASLAVVSIVGTFALALMIGLIGVYGFGWFQRETANYRGQTQAIEQTKADADFRLYSYNTFYDLCSSVQSLEDRIGYAEAKVEVNGSADAQTELDALLSRRSQLIRDYNSKASRDFTEGQFRSNDLPYQINIEGETQCAN